MGDFIIAGICILLGILFLIKGFSQKDFYKQLKSGNLSEFQKTTGTVICCAYPHEKRAELVKPVTPIVEFEVNGEKYEAQNSVLDTGAELPVGTKVVLWYKKDDPTVAVLGTDFDNYQFHKHLGLFLLIFGLGLLIVSL